MINLYDNKSGALLGTISEAQLQVLIDNMEEESTTDQDYYVDGPTLEYLAARGADAELLRILRAALGEQGEMTIRWSE